MVLPRCGEDEGSAISGVEELPTAGFVEEEILRKLAYILLACIQRWLIPIINLVSAVPFGSLALYMPIARDVCPAYMGLCVIIGLLWACFSPLCSISNE